MKINVHEQVVLEKEIDIEDLLCVLKHESETENCTVRVSNNLLKDAALVIEYLLSNPEYDGNAELVEENEKLKDTITKLEEQLECCTKNFNDSMDVNRTFLEKNNELEKDCSEKKLIIEKYRDLSEILEKANDELLERIEKLEKENEVFKQMLNRKLSYELPKVSLDKTKEAKDKVEMVKSAEPYISDFDIILCGLGFML